MIEYKNTFIKLCLQIESLENQKQNTFNYDERKECEKKIKLIKYSIDNLLDKYLDLIKQKDLV